MKNKEKIELIEDMFEEALRKDLPVNLFLLRKRKLNSYSKVKTKCDYYNTENMKVSYYYKKISNIL